MSKKEIGERFYKAYKEMDKEKIAKMIIDCTEGDKESCKAILTEVPKEVLVSVAREFDLEEQMVKVGLGGWFEGIPEISPESTPNGKKYCPYCRDELTKGVCTNPLCKLYHAEFNGIITPEQNKMEDSEIYDMMTNYADPQTEYSDVWDDEESLRKDVTNYVRDMKNEMLPETKLSDEEIIEAMVNYISECKKEL